MVESGQSPGILPSGPCVMRAKLKNAIARNDESTRTVVICLDKGFIQQKHRRLADIFFLSLKFLFGNLALSITLLQNINGFGISARIFARDFSNNPNNKHSEKGPESNHHKTTSKPAHHAITVTIARSVIVI